MSSRTPFCLALVFGSLAAAATTTGSEAPRWYASAAAGAAWTDTSGPITAISVCNINSCPALGTLASASSDPALAATGALGARFDMFRIEVELGYRNAEVSPVTDISQTTLMLNGLVDFALTSNITLSFGGGVGVDFFKWNNAVEDFDDSSFAWQGIARAAHAITETIDLTLNYSYLSATGVRMDFATVQYDPINLVAVSADELDSQTLTIGLNFDL